MKRITKQLPGWLTLSYEFTHEGDEVTVSDISVFQFRPKSKHKIGDRLSRKISKQLHNNINLARINIEVTPKSKNPVVIQYDTSAKFYRHNPFNTGKGWSKGGWTKN